MIAPTSPSRSGSARRKSISKTGMRNASVFPDPVHASTKTSLLLRNSGIAADWTGVILVKPIESTAASETPDSSGRTDENGAPFERTCRSELAPVDGLPEGSSFDIAVNSLVTF